MNDLYGGGWTQTYGRARAISPEAFGEFGAVRNLWEGDWQVHVGEIMHCISPVDGTTLAALPMLDPESTRRAVQYAAEEHDLWSRLNLEERALLVKQAVDAIAAQRDLLAQLLAWEIGKPYAQALTSVDRCVEGVYWYLENIEDMLDGRRPLGLVSNIASWNYPLSVLAHAMLVQMLAGNAVIAKTPTDGGLCSLTLAVALMRRAGLPVSLVSGSGGRLSDALIRHPAVACVAYVGGRGNGRAIEASLRGLGKRYMLEMEGMNAYGVWDFSDWDLLGTQLKKGYEYGKQRCTAYPRFVVQRRLFPQFLRTYLDMVRRLRVGHPLLLEEGATLPPALDYGPLIHAGKVAELHGQIETALARGALSLFEGHLDDTLFLPGQDRSAYLAPVALTNMPRGSTLYHAEPFGPVDTFVVVDTLEELISEMNLSNGSLVASLATDDTALADDVLLRVNAFKTGHNRPRSRGDREETFGGNGESWKGAFVGGEYLVRSVTMGAANEQLPGNFPLQNVTTALP